MRFESLALLALASSAAAVGNLTIISGSAVPVPTGSSNGTGSGGSGGGGGGSGGATGAHGTGATSKPTGSPTASSSSSGTSGGASPSSTNVAALYSANSFGAFVLAIGVMAAGQLI